MLIGDLHEYYDMKSDNAAAKVDDTLNLLTKAVSELEPDFVIYLGDNARAATESQMRSIISRITYPVSSSIRSMITAMHSMRTTAFRAAATTI